MFKTKQKRWFDKKLDGIEKMIWDIEFKRFKVQELRERTRQEYDNQKSKLSVLETQIKAQKDDPKIEKAEIAHLDDKKVLVDRDISRSLEAMKGLDVEIDGLRPSADHPDGVPGVNEQIDALHDLKGIVQKYIKTL